MIYWLILVALIMIGLFDLYLYFTGQRTFSQRIHRLLPKWADILIMIGLLVLTWWLLGGEKMFVPVMVGIIIGHLFWQE